MARWHAASLPWSCASVATTEHVTASNDGAALLLASLGGIPSATHHPYCALLPLELLARSSCTLPPP